jgi:subtilase family serine protease
MSSSPPRRAVALVGALVAAAGLVSACAPADASDPARTQLVGTLPSWASGPSGPAAVAADSTVSLSLLLPESGATPADAAQVLRWVESVGLDAGDLREQAAVLPVSGTRSAVEHAFATTFVSYDAAGRAVAAPAAPFSVPVGLPVEGVAGTVLADAVRPTVATSPVALPRAAAPVDTEECAAHWGETLSSQWPASLDLEHRSNSLCGYGPQQLRDLHEIPDELTGDGATIAVVAAYDDATVEANTNTYFEAYGEQPFAPGQYTHHSPSSPDVDRCGGPAAWTEEQHLDVQAAHAVAPDADIVYWGADDCTTQSLYLRLLDAVEDRPDVVSLSFGASEEMDTPDDRILLNRILVDAATHGVSVFASTGNEGDFSMSGDHAEGPAVASPASSPYITAVGGTSAGLDADGALVVEAGWEVQLRFSRNGAIVPPGFAYGAGGGESAAYPRPSWQSHLPGDGGRMLPDVASLADPNTGFVTYGPHGGTVGYVTHGGTSLATPMVAATVAVAKATSGADVGLAAPYLYVLAETDALRDVVPASAGTWSPTGPDPDALYPESISVWDAKPQTLQSDPGWDPVTGLGVPSGATFFDTFGQQR